MSCLRKSAIKVFFETLRTYISRRFYTLLGEKKMKKVKRATFTAFCEKSLKTLGPNIWKTSKTYLLFQNLQNSLKHYNICKYSCNPYHYTWTSHPSWVWTSGKLISSGNKQNSKCNEILMLWCVYSWFWVYTHPLGFTFIDFFSFWSRISSVQ